MIKDNLCGSNRMLCFGDTCSYMEEPKEEFHWWSITRITTLNCIVTRMQLQANEYDVVAYEGKDGPCKINELQCDLHDGIIIWTDTVIHKCPYSYVETGRFGKKGNLIFTTQKIETKTKAVHLLFQLSGNETKCNLKIYSTTEGLYLTNDDISKAGLDTANFDLTNVKHLLLAYTDYLAHEMLDINKKITNYITAE